MEKIRKAAWLLLLLLCMAQLCFAGNAAAAENGDNIVWEDEVFAAAEANLEEHGLTLEQVIEDFREVRGLKGGGSAFGGYWFPYHTEKKEPSFVLFDVTGDGCADLCTCITWGSGMVRTDLLVYDPLSHELYTLDGYNYDFLIDRATEDRLVVKKRGPNGYGDPITETYGTVVPEEGCLVFVPDDGPAGEE